MYVSLAIFALIKIVLLYEAMFALKPGLILARAGFSTCSAALLQMNVCEVTQCPGSLVFLSRFMCAW